MTLGFLNGESCTDNKQATFFMQLWLSLECKGQNAYINKNIWLLVCNPLHTCMLFFMGNLKSNKMQNLLGWKDPEPGGGVRKCTRSGCRLQINWKQSNLQPAVKFVICYWQFLKLCQWHRCEKGENEHYFIDRKVRDGRKETK